MPTDVPSKHDVFAANGWFRSEAADDIAFKALQSASDWANNMGWESLRTPHIFIGLLSVADSRVREWCRMIGSDPDSLLLQFAAMFRQSSPADCPKVRLHREFISENALGVIRAAYERSRNEGRKRIRSSDLLVAMFSTSGGIVATCFADVGYPREHLAAFAAAAEQRNPDS